MSDYYMARQPILDKEGNLFAFELLYRGNHETIENDMQATADVLVNTLNISGAENILGHDVGFVNISRNLLMDESIFLLPKERFVLEILETVLVDEAVIKRVQHLKASGYRFALDDVTLTYEYLNNFKELLDYIDFVKLDLPMINDKILNSFILYCKQNNIRILAEKVETYEQYTTYHSYGCDYFQGYFFAKPEILHNQRLDPDKIILLDILRLLQEEDIEGTITIFEQNAAITVQLLRFLNSASFAFRNPIKSIRQAVLLLGPKQLRNWILLIAYSLASNNKQAADNPLLYLAQNRSNLMQQLCLVQMQTSANMPSLEEAALTGLLSLADTLFGISLSSLLKELNIDENIYRALVDRQGELGKLLTIIEAIETDDFEQLTTYFSANAIDESTFNKAIKNAYALTDQFYAEIDRQH